MIVLILICFLLLLLNNIVSSFDVCSLPDDATYIRKCFEQLANDSLALLSYISQVEKIHGSLISDGILPSLQMYKSVALFELRRIFEAIDAVKLALKENDSDIRAWSNLAEMQSISGNNKDGYAAYDKVAELTGVPKVGVMLGLVRWGGYERGMFIQEQILMKCMQTKRAEDCERLVYCESREFLELNGSFALDLMMFISSEATRNNKQVDDVTLETTKFHGDGRLVIGFVIAAVLSGPVDSLLQSLIANLDRTRTVVVAFILSSERTISMPWVVEYLQTYDEIINLNGYSDEESAEIIAARGIHVLIDINGNSYYTGINVMRYRPSSIQINYLGDPITSAQHFIDYYIGDRIANPADITDSHFTEKFALLSSSYLVSSHFSQVPDVLLRQRWKKDDMMLMSPEQPHQIEKLSHLSCKRCHEQRTLPVLLGAFHTYNKLSPAVFQVWMNVLRRSPITTLVFNAFLVNPAAMANIVEEARLHGVSRTRMRFSTLTTWYIHTQHKTAIDLYVDTVRKNGHTTSLDATWAGLPTVTLGAQSLSSRRSSESILHSAAEDTHGVVFSLKEYEDLVVALTASVRGRKRLTAWRQYTERARVFGDLFKEEKFADTFLRTLHDVVEAVGVTQGSESGYFMDPVAGKGRFYAPKHNNTNFHVFTSLP